MEAVIGWIVANPGAAAVVGGVLTDVIAGAIPDKYLQYKGAARRVLRGLLGILEK